MFKIIKVDKRSISMRRPIYGVGINDADYQTQPRVSGKKIMCPVYQKWIDMLQRCYSPKFHERYPTYIGCSVIGVWRTFSNFKKWMDNQDWQGNELDKDLLIQGNKLYSPETCLLVSRQINMLLTDHKAKRGKYPIGVNFDKRSNKYNARVRVYGKLKHIGSFDNPELAYEAYKSEKYAIIKSIAITQSEPIRSALLKYKIGIE